MIRKANIRLKERVSSQLRSTLGIKDHDPSFCWPTADPLLVERMNLGISWCSRKDKYRPSIERLAIDLQGTPRDRWNCFVAEVFAQHFVASTPVKEWRKMRVPSKYRVVTQVKELVLLAIEDLFARRDNENAKRLFQLMQRKVFESLLN